MIAVDFTIMCPTCRVEWPARVGPFPFEPPAEIREHLECCPARHCAQPLLGDGNQVVVRCALTPGHATDHEGDLPDLGVRLVWATKAGPIVVEIVRRYVVPPP